MISHTLMSPNLSQGPGSGRCDRKCSKDKDAEWGAMALPFSSWFPLVTILDLSWSWCLHQLQYGHHCGVVLGKGSRHLFIVLTRSVSVGRQGGQVPIREDIPEGSSSSKNEPWQKPSPCTSQVPHPEYFPEKSQLGCVSILDSKVQWGYKGH